MRTKFTFGPIFTIGIIWLLVLSMWPLSPAFSSEGEQVSLELALQTALRENPGTQGDP